MAELEPVEITSSKIKEEEPAFVDLVGQISLRTLEKNERKKRDRDRQMQQNRPGNKPMGGSSGGNRNAAPPNRDRDRGRGNQGPGRNRPPQSPQNNRPPAGPRDNDGKGQA